MPDRPDITKGAVAKALNEALTTPKLSTTIRIARDVPPPPQNGATLLDPVTLYEPPPVNKSGTVGEGVVNDLTHGTGKINDVLFSPFTTHTKWAYSGHGLFGNTLLDVQEKFAKDHAGDLKNMNRNAVDMYLALRRFRDATAKAPHYDGGGDRLDTLLAEKKVMGDELMRRIDARIDEADSDEERTRLEDLKKNLTGWQGERDERIKAEMPEWRSAIKAISGVDRQGNIQSRRIDKALDSADAMRGQYGSTPTTDLANLTRPQNAAFMVGMRDFLLGCRGEMDYALEQSVKND